MSIRRIFNPCTLASEGTKSSPAADVLMADTGALAKGRWEVRVVVGSTAGGSFLLQRRTVANDGAVGPVLTLRCPDATASSEFILTYDVEAGERIRVVMCEAPAGDVEAAIQVEKLG